MIWQDGFSGMAGRTDPEEERELRLAAQARAGADWALGALVARYQPPVTRYLTRLSGNPDFARRAAEQIFVRLERRVRGPQGGHNLRLWLLRACTEAGLEFLRAPSRPSHVQLADPEPAALLTGRGGGAAHRLRAGLESLASRTGTTGRQVRELIFPIAPPPKPRTSAGPAPSRRTTPPLAGDADPYGALDPTLDTQDPREALRHRLVRAVLAELPYGDAQCLALHLVAGLNQTQVARALGITASASRRRIVQGLQLFAQRYEAAAASLGLPPEPEPEPEREPEPEPAPAFAPPAVREVNDVADEPTRVLQTPWDATGAAADMEPVEAQSEVEAQQAWTPELATVVEPRHEIIVDATPPEGADVLDAEGAAAAADSGADVGAHEEPAPPAAPARRTEPRVVEGTVAAVRIVPALTPLPMPEPQLPPELSPATARWSAARSIPVLTGPLPAIRSRVGPSFAAEPGAARRVPVLTADAERGMDADADRDTGVDTAAGSRSDAAAASVRRG